jgi:hypothetical protein
VLRFLLLAMPPLPLRSFVLVVRHDTLLFSLVTLLRGGGIRLQG